MPDSNRYRDARPLHTFILTSTTLISIWIAACAPAGPHQPNDPDAEQRTGAAPLAEPEFPVPSPSPSSMIAESTGWKELILTSDYAEIKFDPTGHWSISRNNCWVGGYGAMTLSEWNAFAIPLNEILSARRTGEDKTVCIPQGTSAKAWKGPIDLVRDDGTKTSLFVQNFPDELCTDRDARGAAFSLRNALDAVLPRAFSEDCTMPLG